MRLWLYKSAEVSLREQLMTQIVLAILSREMLPGARLPSTRELARRFEIHSNTASAAYRELERQGWVEFRHGSGVFVRSARPSTPLTPELAIDQLIGELAARARKLGAPEALLRARLRRWLSFEPPARWLVIEPDTELRRIVVLEMEQELALPVAGCAPEECGEQGPLGQGTPDQDARGQGRLTRAIPVVLPSKALLVRQILPPGVELAVLKVQPVSPELQAHLQRYLPEHGRDLIGIASRWGDFQRIARTMLIAAGLAPESLLVRDATRPGWKRGLEAASGVVCDAVTATELPSGCFPLTYRLLGPESFAHLRGIEAALTAGAAPA